MKYLGVDYNLKDLFQEEMLQATWVLQISIEIKMISLRNLYNYFAVLEEL